MGASHRVDDARVHAQRAAGIAQHAARPVGNDHGGQRGAIPAVFIVDVLDDLFAALVLEVHVDVGRLVAFFADEALEQAVAARRVHFGDAQAVADRGVGGGPGALAQDADAAGVLDDVVDGQEIGLVAQLGDQGQFFFDLGGHLGRNAGGEAAGGPGLRFLAQIRGGRVAAWNDLVRVFVAQFLKRERAAAGHHQRLGQRLRRIEAGQPHARAQVLLGVAGQFVAALGHGLAGADAGQRVVQRFARAQVHLHLAQRHDGQPGGLGGVDDRGAVQVVAGPMQQGQPYPGAAGKGARQPARLLRQAVGVGAVGGTQDGQAFGQVAQVGVARGRMGEVFGGQPVLALGSPGAGQGDELRQIAVAFAGLRQQGQAQRRGVGRGAQLEGGADQQRQVAGLGLHVGADRARQRALVGDGQRRVAQFGGAGDQLFRMRGALQEGEVGLALQLGVAGQAGRNGLGEIVFHLDSQA